MIIGNILSPVMLKQYIELWISEDVSSFDLSCISVGPEEVSAHIEMKRKGVIAGIPFVDATFNYLDCVVVWRFEEGSLIEKDTIVASVHGPLSKLLMAEGTALNILGRASAVATIARRVSMKLNGKWKGEVTGTRKTSPGMRMVEKYAMIVGGICTQHYDPSSIVLIKDHHVKIHGSIKDSVKVVRERAGRLVSIAVECHSTKEAKEAAISGANVVLLEGLKVDEIKSISKEVKQANPLVLIEVSGGINENNILEYAIANVDIISSSIFCQGYKAVEMCFNVVSNDVSSTHEDTEVDIVLNDNTEFDVVDGRMKNNTSGSAISNSDATDIVKVTTEREFDETSGSPEDIKTETTAVASSKNESKKIVEKPRRATAQSKYQHKPAKMTKRNARKSESAIFYARHLASIRQSECAMGPGAPRDYGGSDARLLNSIAAGLSTMNFPDRPEDESFFRGAGPIMYGGRLSRSDSSLLGQPRTVEHPYRCLSARSPFGYS